MKINGLEDIPNPPRPLKTPQKQDQANPDFGKILQESVAKNEPGSRSAGPSIVLRTADIPRMNPLNSSANAEPLKHTEDLLQLLESYRRQLADPHTSLKQLGPLVNRIAAHSNQMSQMLDTLPDTDRLKAIMNDTLVTASLEVIKFNRGDYIPS